MTAIVLLVVLVIATAFNIVAQVREDRRRVVADKLLAEKHDAILSMLLVWAEHWGDPPDRVRALLKEALKR